MRHKIKHLHKDKKLAKAIKSIRLEKIEKRKNHYQTLVRGIIGQQLSVKAANTIMNRFLSLFPKAKFPYPEEILEMDKEKMRQCGISYSKIEYIKDLSRKILDGVMDMKKIDEMDDEAVITHLTQVKGIGRWTAEMFLIFSLAREDVFSYGDLGLRNAMVKIYGLKKHPSPEKAQKISDTWKPYRSLACRFLWKTLDNEAKSKAQNPKS